MKNNLGIPEYDLETDELIYRDRTGNEVRRESLNEKKMNVLPNTELRNDQSTQNDNEGENGTFSLPRDRGNYPCPGDSYIIAGRHIHNGLHPGGKEFYLLRSKNPICEAAGWIAIL